MEALDPLMQSKLSLNEYSEPHIYIMCMEAVCPSVRRFRVENCSMDLGEM
jgi:hypothetical protein